MGSYPPGARTKPATGHSCRSTTNRLGSPGSKRTPPGRTGRGAPSRQPGPLRRIFASTRDRCRVRVGPTACSGAANDRPRGAPVVDDGWGQVFPELSMREPRAVPTPSRRSGSTRIETTIRSLLQLLAGGLSQPPPPEEARYAPLLTRDFATKNGKPLSPLSPVRTRTRPPTAVPRRARVAKENSSHFSHETSTPTPYPGRGQKAPPRRGAPCGGTGDRPLIR